MEQIENFLHPHSKLITTQRIRKSTIFPFKNHSQFSILTDIISRKNQHHVLLQTTFSEKFYLYFLESFLLTLHQENTLKSIREAPLLSINIQNLTLANLDTSIIKENFSALKNQLNNSPKCLLLVLTNAEELWKNSHTHALLASFIDLLNHPRCRLLMVSKTPLANLPENHYQTIHLATPSEYDIEAILKQECDELEYFHQIVIPKELIDHTRVLAERFLPTENTTNNTILLIDSAAARFRLIESALHEQSRPILTTNWINQVLSDWTGIPISSLHRHAFKLSDFISGMSLRIFGQEAAVTLLSHELQKAHANLQQHNGPFSSFLFAGPAHSGKRATVLALAEQLFKQINMVYIATLHSENSSLLEVKLQRCIDKQFLPCKEIIKQTPHAILLIENIELATSKILEQLQEILNIGSLLDEEGKQYCFQQTIFIFSTQKGELYAQSLSNNNSQPEETNNTDLLQLITNEQKTRNIDKKSPPPQEIAKEMLQEVLPYLPNHFCQQIQFIPFLPLNNDALEKIIRLKLKLLNKILDVRYGIALSYAPEIVKHISQQSATNMDTALKKLYFIVEQAILSRNDHHQSNQLFLQLNETGQILRCDWLELKTTGEVRRNIQ